VHNNGEGKAVNSTWLVAGAHGFFLMMALIAGTGDAAFEVCAHVRRVDILSSGSEPRTPSHE
jgi:hypothetical protein